MKCPKCGGRVRRNWWMIYDTIEYWYACMNCHYATGKAYTAREALKKWKKKGGKGE